MHYFPRWGCVIVLLAEACKNCKSEGPNRPEIKEWAVLMEKIFAFSLFLFACVSLYWFLVPQRWRGLFLLIVSLFFAAVFSIKYAVYFLFNVALVYWGSTFVKRDWQYKRLSLQLILIWIVGSLCFFKYIGPAIPSLEILWPVGISYITFRLVHYIVETYRKNAPESSFADFALYVLFFPTFLAGPVERFPRFHAQLAGRDKVDISEINYGLFRIVLGLLKKFVIADNLVKFIMPILHAPQGYTEGAVILSIYGLAVWLYTDFSGYADMAIGISRLFGYKIVENFDRPFLQKNIALFWRSWHISVYSWIRDYFFFPFFGHRPSPLKTYTGIFCSMVVFNLWHKGSWSFLALGVYHGAGLVVWHLFQDVKRAQPWLHRLVARPVLDPLSTVLTFSFVSFGLILFSLDMNGVNAVLRRMFLG